MDFAEPSLIWLLLASPAVAGLAYLAWRRRLGAVGRWAARSQWRKLLPTYRPGRMALSAVLLGLAFLGTVLTLARPRWGASEQQVERQGVDIAVILDTSLSMATTDVQPSRLWVAQTLIRQLVRSLPGNRVALVQAEGEGVVMVPLTSDIAAIDLLLDAVLPGSLPVPGTELAPAFDRALELFPEDGGKHRVIVLVSDGEDHGSKLAEIGNKLTEQGVVIHAIGVGTREGKLLEMPFRDPGAPVQYKMKEDGKTPVLSRLVEDTLEGLSRETGGVYVRATSAATDLGKISARIGDMEKRTYGSDVVSALEERFQWPLALAILALALHLLVPPFARREAGL